MSTVLLTSPLAGILLVGFVVGFVGFFMVMVTIATCPTCPMGMVDGGGWV